MDSKRAEDQNLRSLKTRRKRVSHYLGHGGVEVGVILSRNRRYNQRGRFYGIGKRIIHLDKGSSTGKRRFYRV